MKISFKFDEPIWKRLKAFVTMQTQFETGTNKTRGYNISVSCVEKCLNTILIRNTTVTKAANPPCVQATLLDCFGHVSFDFRLPATAEVS